MRKYVRTGHGRRQVGGIRQRRQLVAKVRAGQNSAGSRSQRHAHALRDAHQRQTHGTHGTPGSTGSQRGNRADYHCCNQENRRRQQLKAIIDHGRNSTRQDPYADHHADDTEDQDGLHCHRDTVNHHAFDVLPLVADLHRHQGSDDNADEHRDVRINSVYHDPDGHNDNDA